MSHRQILTILLGLLLGMFLAALDQTIVSTSIPRIANDLHGLNIQAWVTTAYLITSTITTPLYGKLSDIYGRKPFYLVAISIFIVGSAASSFATSMYELAAFRAFQGLGAGGLMSLAFTILGDIVSPRERAKNQGYFLAVFGLSSVLGPVVGGALSGANSILGITGWRWVFLVNVPIGLVALAVVAKVLNVPHNPRNQRIDWWGAITLVIGIVPVLIIAEQGQQWGWGSPRAIILYAVGAVGIGLFVMVEKLMGESALIPLRLFRSSTFSTVILAGTIVGAAMFGAITLIPQYLQIVRGDSPTVSGLQMLPLMVGLMASSIMSGQITSRTGRYKIFPVIGSVFIIGGSLLFTQVTVDSPIWQPMLYMVVLGFGVGNCMQTLTLAAQNAVPVKDMGVSTASATFFRQIGGTLGVAVFLSILFSTVGGKIADSLRSAGTAFHQAVADPAVLHNPVNAPILSVLHGGGTGGLLQDASFLQTVDSRLARPFLAGFSDSIDLVFWIVAGLSVVALLVTVFIKEIPLRTMSGVQAMAESEGSPAPLPVADEVPVTGSLDDELDAIQAFDRPELVGAGKHAMVGQTAPAGAVSLNGNGVHEAVTGTPVSGRVRRSDDAPAVGAVLTLINHSGQQVARGTSHEDGGYQLVAPLDGTYVLIASSAGHQPQASTLRAAGDPVTMDVLLTGTARATGVVRANGTEPVAGATVTLTDPRGEVVGSATTGPDGGYVFTDLLGGGYTLVVAAAGYRPYAASIAVPDSGDATTDVALSGAARLTGTATGGPGLVPVRDARVTLVDSSGTVVAMTTTDEHGGYSFGDLPEGEYTVIASGYPPVSGHRQIGAGEDGVHDVVLGHGEL
ncbi:MAG TPA: DHA2 family efflux MFS transporter permease subunit [Pseudonocardiaceae bacterium]|nr:DHA2 family efflux MFS transporter permease subunit [Pseudonocardiaceae bacterium]